MSKESLTQERLKELLHYNPDTGIFTSIKHRKKAPVGKIAGWDATIGYRCIGIDGKEYLAHRLAFLYMDGNFPPDIVDHINRIKGDNRWCNLRHATPLLNAHNMKSNNDFIGVLWLKHEERWSVQSSLPDNRKFLGYYLTYFAACYARHYYNLGGFDDYSTGALKIVREKSKIRVKNKNNKSGYIGVHKKSKKWVATAGKYVGTYPNKIDAAVARDSYVISNNLGLMLNFPQPITEIRHRICRNHNEMLRPRNEQ